MCPAPVTIPHQATQLFGFGTGGIAFLGDTWSLTTAQLNEAEADNTMLSCLPALKSLSARN